MIVYHHDDLDGMTAAYVVHSYKPKQIEDFPSSYFACTYEDKFDKHTAKDDVVIVDISISEKTYQMLLDTCKTARSVTWIDHHATSADIVEKHFEELQSIENLTYMVSNNGCGALLAYLYFHVPASEFAKIRDTNKDQFYKITVERKASHLFVFTAVKQHKGNNNTFVTEEFMEHEIIIPEYLAYVDDHDRWQKKFPETENFFFGTGAENISFILDIGERKVYNPFWTSEKIKDTKSIIKSGEDISKYIHNQYKTELCECFEYTIDGTKFLCKNGRGNSYNFEDSIKHYPAVILFSYDASCGKWTYSVYSDEQSSFNCKEFCEKFGGGGHIHASGFSTEKLIFTHGAHIRDKDNTIFLGGTWNGSDWRSKFIQVWKKIEEADKDLKSKKIKLFNPIVEDWTIECQKEENRIKETAKINLFVITPEQKGMYSFAEMIDCAANGSTVYLAVFPNNGTFDADMIKSLDAIGKLVEKYGGVYEKYLDDEMEDLVKDVIASL